MARSFACKIIIGHEKKKTSDENLYGDDKSNTDIVLYFKHCDTDFSR